ERFKVGHDIATALAKTWLANASTSRARLFPRAGRIGPRVRGSAWHGWVFSV
ncbi:hypothetical protein EK21DRAFT_70502, partial [Setomelanomma holmii]